MQHVNLLNDMPNKKIILPASMLFQIFIVFILGLFATSIWQWGRIIYKYKELGFATQQAIHSERKHTKLVQEYPIIAAHKSIKHAISKLSSTLKVEKFKFENLSQHILTSGFSIYLDVFAKNLNSSLSLDGFEVSHVKSNIALYGIALNARAVSEMVEKLYFSPLFENVTFDKYVLTLDENAIKFEVATNHLVNKHTILKSAREQGSIQQKLLMKVNK